MRGPWPVNHAPGLQSSSMTPATWPGVCTYSSSDLCSPRGSKNLDIMIPERSVTENHDLVSSGKSETRPACQRRNEKDKYVGLILEPIDQGHACGKHNQHLAIVTDCACSRSSCFVDPSNLTNSWSVGLPGKLGKVELVCVLTVSLEMII